MPIKIIAVIKLDEIAVYAEPISQPLDTNLIKWA
jgi:hypothetical protein